jgi:hypothetical protein
MQIFGLVTYLSNLFTMSTNLVSPHPSSSSVDILILGAGWTSAFLIPLLKEQKVEYAATTRSGHDNTLTFTFDPQSNDAQPFRVLPNAHTVLITFPIYGAGGSARLLKLYQETHPDTSARFIQLGSTGIYDVSQTSKFWAISKSCIGYPNSSG